MEERSYFDELIGSTIRGLEGGEVLLATYTGEETDFVRFNHGDVRQAGTIEQAEVDLELIDGDRHVRACVQLTRDRDLDRSRLMRVVAELREQVGIVAADPYLLFNTEPMSTEQVGRSEVPDSLDAIASIRGAGAGLDLVGIYTAGRISNGFANSLGQRNWFESSTFDFDWTFYERNDKAAKNVYAGFRWDDEAFVHKVEASGRQLEVLRREPIDLAPGGYRAYLTPAATHELMDLVAYGAFGLRHHRTMRTPLLHMVTEGATLAPGTRFTEDTAGGVAPNFQEQGYIRPEQVVLIEDGAYLDTLVSPRSAREYGVATNGASAGEYPESLALTPGSLPASQAVEALGTGLYIGNLWYTNYSDRSACRVTGMTRFATFWVDGGELVAPVNVLRFDDTLFNLLGAHLVDFSDEAELVFDPSTYGRRSTASMRLPGALIEEMRFTL